MCEQSLAALCGSVTGQYSALPTNTLIDGISM